MKLAGHWSSRWLGFCVLSTSTAWKFRHEDLDSGSGTAGQQLDADKKCRDHACGTGWVLKLDHLIRHGNTDAACCDKTCALWTCTSGYAPNPNYKQNVAQSNDMCCDDTCAHVRCERGFKNKGASVIATSQAECCDSTCELFNCLGNWSQKRDYTRVGSDLETCCDPHCSLFDCAAVGMEHNPATSNRIGSSKGECCVKTCSSWKCPAGYAVPKSKRHLQSPNDEICCQQKYCSAFSCDAGWVRNVTANGTIGHSNEECCLPTCEVYSCNISAGWANSADKSKMVGADTDTCCVPACNSHTCSDDWVPNKTAAAQPGQTDAACCTQTCRLHECDESLGWKTKPGTADLVAESPDTCCASTCQRHVCSTGWIPDQDVAAKEGSSNSECCLGTCRLFTCDASQGWLQDPAALDKVGNDEAACCQEACSRHTCSAGWLEKKGEAHSPGSSDEECCDKSCKLHSCSSEVVTNSLLVWHKEPANMAPVGAKGSAVKAAMVEKSSIGDCQSFCAGDPNLIGMGFLAQSCWCYTTDLTAPVYSAAARSDGNSDIESWSSSKPGFQGFSKKQVLSDDYACSADVVNLARGKTVYTNSLSPPEANNSNPSHAVDGKSDRLLSKGWMSACSAKTSQVCAREAGKPADDCPGNLHDWRSGEDKPYLEVDMGRVVKVLHLKATNFEEPARRTRGWSLQSSLKGKAFQKVLGGNATGDATWAVQITAGGVGRYFRFVLEEPRAGDKDCQGLIELELHGQDDCHAKNGPDLVKIPNSDSNPGDSDAECCEPASCQAWPRKLVEAKDGCELVATNQDCNQMFEKSTSAADGSTSLTKCGYKYVAGQVYRCSTLDQSRLSCSS